MPPRKSKNKTTPSSTFILSAAVVFVTLLTIFSNPAGGGSPLDFLAQGISRAEKFSSSLSNPDNPGKPVSNPDNPEGSLSGGGSGLGSNAAGQEALTVHFIDVGQADSIFIQSGDHCMLIDAGNNDDGEALVRYLQEQQVERLDYVIGSHPHEDHIGGLDDVINNFAIDAILMPPKAHTTKSFEDVIDALEARQLSITFPEPGKTYTLGSAEFTLLGPLKDYEEDLNNWSIALILSNGIHSFFFGGDIEAAAEADILSAYPYGLKTDVLKLSHHGSSTSSSEAFLEALSPSFAVASCGAGNSYGHPHQEVLTALEDRHIQLYRTDRQGTILVTSQDGRLTWQTEKGD
ncbi:MAG: MBL fold metallo-hydrolase [Clostridiales bacterium]